MKIINKLIFVLFLISNVMFSQIFIEQTAIIFPNLENSKLDWGDYNNDGFLDVVITGTLDGSVYTRVFKNNGDNTFSEQSITTLENVVSGDVEWGDYNNDGLLDILLSGFSSINNEITYVYKNNGDNTFTQTFSALGLSSSSVTWADYDNDGFLDFMVSGRLLGANSEPFLYTRLYRNVNGTFVQTNSFQGLSSANISWGDYNNDGYKDFIATGKIKVDIIGGFTFRSFSALYKNNGDGTFTINESSNLESLYGESKFGDFNNDGFLDILHAGYNTFSNSKKVILYTNNGDESFTANFEFPGSSNSSVSLADFNNDGFLDILIGGFESSPTTKIYRNFGFSFFSEQTTESFQGIYNGKVTWADYDNDDLLDILITGEGITKLYKNTDLVNNQKPNTILNLQQTINENSITFSWDSATDINQSGGLSYNLYIYAEDFNLISVSAFPQTHLLNGKRVLVENSTFQGVRNGNTISYTLNRSLEECINYFWSVQAIDGGLKGGEFSVEQSFIIDNSLPVPNVNNLDDITAECSISTLIEPTATDKCDGIIIGSHNATLPITNQGNNLITWTFEDQNGNTTTQIQNVIINDNSLPELNSSTLEDILADCEITELTVPIATDNCAGLLFGTHNATLPINTNGTTEIIWTYDDGNGNIINQSQNVIINDMIDPIPDLVTLDDIFNECEIITLETPTATDNCFATILGSHNAKLPITEQGTTEIIWTYDDENGNIVSQTQNVFIEDTTNPIAIAQNLEFDLNGASSLTILASQVDNGSSDNCNVVNLSLDIDTFTEIGVFNITLNVEDNNQNISSNSAIITIIDSTISVNDTILSNKIIVYPNPTEGILTLKLEDSQLKSASIYTIFGKKIMDYFTQKIDVSDLTSGTYFIKITTIDEKSIVKKIIIR